MVFPHFGICPDQDGHALVKPDATHVLEAWMTESKGKTTTGILVHFITILVEARHLGQVRRGGKYLTCWFIISIRQFVSCL